MPQLACPTCAHAIQVSEELVGRVARCRGCQARLAIRRGESGALALALAPAPAAAATPPSSVPAERIGGSAPCPSCRAPLRASDAFCASCGAPVSAPSRQQIAEAGARSARSAQRREKLAQKDAETRERHIGQAAGVMKWLAILFVFFGLLEGVIARRAADGELAAISAEAQDEDPLELADGSVMLVREFREQQELLVTLSYTVNFVLAAILFALYLWALRSPLPATLTALSVYLVLTLLQVLADPRELLSGLILEVICIGFLLRGIQAALAERAARAAAERRAAHEGAGA